MQNYRHDLLNELQIIQGYASMGKQEKVDEKINQLIDVFHQERRLLSLQASRFALWIMQFNHTYGNIRITYDIHVENIELGKIDRTLVLLCEQVINCMADHSEKDAYYEGILKVQKHSDGDKIIVHFSFTGKEIAIAALKKCLMATHTYQVMETDTGFTCSFTISSY